jgi:hypothetical protein
MSAAELKELRNGAKEHIDHADENIVRMVYAMLEVNAENEKEATDLSPEHDAILDEHLALFEKGLMEFSNWEDARARISSKIKNAI